VRGPVQAHRGPPGLLPGLPPEAPAPPVLITSFLTTFSSDTAFTPARRILRYADEYGPRADPRANGPTDLLIPVPPLPARTALSHSVSSCPAPPLSAPHADRQDDAGDDQSRPRQVGPGHGLAEEQGPQARDRDRVVEAPILDGPSTTTPPFHQTNPSTEQTVPRKVGAARTVHAPEPGGAVAPGAAASPAARSRSPVLIERARSEANEPFETTAVTPVSERPIPAHCAGRNRSPSSSVASRAVATGATAPIRVPFTAPRSTRARERREG
jgi:hypothetical protein